MASLARIQSFRFAEAVGLLVPAGFLFQILFPVDPFGVLLGIIWAICGGSIAALMLFVSICRVKEGIPWLKFALLGANVLLTAFITASLFNW